MFTAAVRDVCVYVANCFMFAFAFDKGTTLFPAHVSLWTLSFFPRASRISHTACKNMKMYKAIRDVINLCVSWKNNIRDTLVFIFLVVPEEFAVHKL